MKRSFFNCNGKALSTISSEELIGSLVERAGGVESSQRFAWNVQLNTLRQVATDLPDAEFFWEFQIPRTGKRADVIVYLGGRLLVLEFKVGAENFDSASRAQVLDYALDLKNFHSGSHRLSILPVLICTKAISTDFQIEPYPDRILKPIQSNGGNLVEIAQYDPRGVLVAPLLYLRLYISIDLFDIYFF